MNIYIFIWLLKVLVAACRIFGCSTWDLVPWPGMEPGPPALGAQTVSHWTAREVPKKIYLNFYKNLVFSENVLFCLGSSPCSWHLSEMRRDRNKKKLQVSLVALSIILPHFPDGLFVLWIEGLWQSCIEQVYCHRLLNSICSLHISVSQVGNSQSSLSFLVIIIFVIVTCDLWCSYDSLKAQVMVSTF